MIVALVTVEVEARFQAPGQCGNRWVIRNVDVFVREHAPKTFDEDVVEGPAPVIHSTLARGPVVGGHYTRQSQQGTGCGSPRFRCFVPKRHLEL